MKGSFQNDASWQPTSNFIDSNGTATEALPTYISKNDLPKSILPRSAIAGGENSKTT